MRGLWRLMGLLLYVILEIDRCRGWEWNNYCDTCTRFEVALTCEVAACGDGERNGEDGAGGVGG